MSVHVTYKPRGALLPTTEERDFDADSFEITEDGRIELFRDGGFVGEVKANIWETVYVEGDEGGGRARKMAV